MAMPAIIAAQAASRRGADTALLDAFRLADATAADRAQTPARLRIEPGEAFARLVEAGIVRDAGRGRYYLDEAAVVAARVRAGRPFPPRGAILVVGLLLLAVLAAFGMLAEAL